MATRLGQRSGSRTLDVTDIVVGAVATLDPAGATADEIAQVLSNSLDGAGLQPKLEMLVGSGVLDRRGIGRGALYTLTRRGRAHAARASKSRAQSAWTSTMPSRLAV